MGILENLIDLRQKIPAGVKLIAVSKTRPVTDIMQAYRLGHRIFGENKARELELKHSQLPEDIEWHFIGHLQTNKIKYIAPYVTLIHSVDSFNLLQAIHKEALKIDRTIDCLLQFHIATEETKFGFHLEEAKKMLQSDDYHPLKNVRVTGIMGMASFTRDDRQIREEFKALQQYHRVIKTTFFDNNPGFKEISMGMSGDFQIAVEEGSTMVRIGTLLFGERNYP